MAYNILGINPFHNGSVCVLSDGEVVYYLEEERLTKEKYDSNPFRVILDVISKFKIDEVVIAGINLNDRKLGYSDLDPFISLIKKFNPNIKKFFTISDRHHLAHTLHSFYNSGFDKALGIVIDAGGSEFFSNTNSSVFEQDSIFLIENKEDNTDIKKIYSLSNPIPNNKSTRLNIAETYSFFTHNLGFKQNEEGKTMGLSSYGQLDPKIPEYFNYDSCLSYENIVDIDKMYCFTKNQKILNSLGFIKNNSNKNRNFTQSEKNLAWSIQNTTQNVVSNYIEHFTKKTNTNKVVCSGGLFLNCVANYHLTKKFPNIEFYFEPVSHDGGTAIGASYYRWKDLNPNFKFKKQNKIYYGPKYSKKEILKGIKKYV